VTNSMITDPPISDSHHLSINLSTELGAYLSKLYENPQIPISYISSSYQATCNLVNNVIMPLVLKNPNNSEMICKSMGMLDTHYKRTKQMQLDGTFICPKEIVSAAFISAFHVFHPNILLCYDTF